MGFIYIYIHTRDYYQRTWFSGGFQIKILIGNFPSDKMGHVRLPGGASGQFRLSSASYCG